MKVQNTIQECPDDGLQVESRTLVIANHWNMTDRVVLIIEGKEFIYLAEDLIKAIHNATNHR